MTGALLTASEVAEHLRLHIETVYRLARQGKLPAVKVGEQWRFSEATIRQWLTGNTGPHLPHSVQEEG